MHKRQTIDNISKLHVRYFNRINNDRSEIAHRRGWMVYGVFILISG